MTTCKRAATPDGQPDAAVRVMFGQISRTLGGAEGTLFGIVAASYVASAIMCMAVTYLGLNWKR
jgi:hypothetical protein